MIRLCRARIGEVIIKEIPSGDYRRKLINFHIIPGMIIKLVKNNKGSPILVKVLGTTIMLNRQFARQIMVVEI